MSSPTPTWSTEANGGRPQGLLLHDLELGVGRQEAAGVVAAHAQRGLREVVRAEAEELGGLRDLVRRERATRDFDHRANEVACEI
jgi:hypothetical protein